MKWHHGGIQVKSLIEAIRFYECFFGFKKAGSLNLTGEKIAFMRREGIMIELIEGTEGAEDGCRKIDVHLAWEVEDLEKWILELAEKDLHPSDGPLCLEEMDWRTVFYTGCNGETIELMECKSSIF
ncbi:VOC family protein [Falsibacillus pallidus]|uniref:VOC family protein n=1 Tax=Falsibacillus pallidus TaxID=493781 RepID=UPI003D98BFA0